MNELDFLLTDEFAAFSQKIAAIHEEKKNIQEEMKRIFDELKGKLAGLDKEASNLITGWENWKASKAKKQG